MNIDEVRIAGHLLEKIDRHDRLYGEIKNRKVDFIENDRVRALGRNQMDEREIERLQDYLCLAVGNWFSERREALVKELETTGVDTKVWEKN